MLGNSSSGIIEAASLNTPVVNIGERQRGREVSANVIQVDNNAENIVDGYNKALKLKGRDYENIYGDGQTSSKIINALLGI
jgi:UDP-N-acetylglucosamine 2-epimerase